MSAPHTLPFDMFIAPVEMSDPGNAGSIYLDRSPAVVPFVSAGAETRTLARPTRTGAICILQVRTYVGAITLTVTGGYDTNGSTTMVFSAAGQFAIFVSYYDGTNYGWRLLSDYGTGNLNGLLATAAEINRNNKASTRLVASGAALALTQALHDGKTIVLAAVSANTLPAMTGSGSRYRFVCGVDATAVTITATAAHLFGSLVMNTDSAFQAGTLFTVGAAANGGGSTIITLDGTTKGGHKGDWIDIEDVATSVGIVRGILNGSGTEATPFS